MEEVIVLKQEEAEGRFLEHRGEAEELLRASLCFEPVKFGFADILGESRHEEDLWGVWLVEEIIKRDLGGGGGTY